MFAHSIADLRSGDVTIIGNELYCLTPEAMGRIFDRLDRMGYDVTRRSETEMNSRSMYGNVPEQDKIGGAKRWGGTLQIASVGKCGSCNRYISSRGIQTHGHECEECGAVTYLELIKGTEVELRFLDENGEYDPFAPSLTMPVERWDTDDDSLYLKYEFRRGGYRTATRGAAIDYLRKHAGKWTIVTEKGQRLLKVKYELRVPQRDRPGDDVHVYANRGGHYRNYRDVHLFDLIEYSAESFSSRLKFPLPRFVYIHEAWKWSRLAPSHTLHVSVIESANQVAYVDYYDKRPEVTWNEHVYSDIILFLDKFTSVDRVAVSALFVENNAHALPRDPIVGINLIHELCDPTYVPRVLTARKGVGESELDWNWLSNW